MKHPDSGFRRSDGALLIAAAVLMISTLAGSIAAIVHYPPDKAIGPLSEWVPGTATSFALVVVLLQEHRRRREERQRAERWQAERVHYWLENRVEDKARVVYAVISNMSDQPVYGGYLRFESNERPEPRISISVDVVPPHCERYEVKAFSESEMDWPPASGFKFADGTGERIWLREEHGALVGPLSEDEWQLKRDHANRRRSQT